MEFDWKSVVKTVAPMLGTAVGGPFGGMAAKFIAGAVLDDENASEEDVATALMSATPEQLQKLKDADHNFKLKMKELGIKEKQLQVEDTKSARTMFTSTGTWVVPVLATITVTAFFATMFYVLTGSVTLESTILGFVLGQISAKTEQVYNFFFGSSVGSKEKTEHMAKKS